MVKKLTHPNERAINPLIKRYKSRDWDGLRTTWTDLLRENGEAAFEWINDPDIAFPILYSLAPELADVHDNLTVKHQMAINHIFSVLNGDPFGIIEGMDLLDQYHYCVECFEWMIRSGGLETVDSQYPYVIDHACDLLLHHFHHDCLQDIVDILFYRNRSGGQRHYILSTFYNAANPIGLIYVAKYLRSKDAKDIAFAKSILSFIPDVVSTPPLESESRVLTWLEENRDYLIYTYETNDSHPHPEPFRIHYPAKYLGIPIDHTSGSFLYPLGESFEKRYQDFQALPLHFQKQLSAYSLQLRRTNRGLWYQWIAEPLNTQVTILQQRGWPL